MTGNLNLFSSLDNSIQTHVTLGNNVCWVKYMLSNLTLNLSTREGSL